MRSAPADMEWDLLAFGEALLDLFPDVAGGYAGVRAFAVWPGGAPANVALGVAAAGLRVAFLGKVGPDPLGEGLLSRMQAGGVDTRHMVRSSGTPTGVTFVVRQEDGERSFFPYRHLAADKEIGPEDIPEGPFGHVRMVHLGANCMALPASAAATARVLDLAEAHGCAISFDPNLRPHFHLRDPAALERVRQIAARAQVVKWSREETGPLWGSFDAACDALLERGRAELIVETRDREGAVWRRRGGAEGREGGTPRTVVDATGAGDAFMAGMLADLLDEDAPPLTALDDQAVARAVTRGNRFGATCVGIVGATAAWPDPAGR